MLQRNYEVKYLSNAVLTSLKTGNAGNIFYPTTKL